MVWMMPPLNSMSWVSRTLEVRLLPERRGYFPTHEGTAYALHHGGSGSVPAGENIQVAGLQNAADHLAAGHIVEFRVVQPGWIELEGADVRIGAMDASDDVVLQHGMDGINLVFLEGISNLGVVDIDEGVVGRDEDGDVLLEGKIGIDISIGRGKEKGSELGQVGVAFQHLG